MTFTHGLLFGLFGTTFTIVGFFIANLVYERHRKRIEQIEADKKEEVSYGFK